MLSKGLLPRLLLLCWQTFSHVNAKAPVPISGVAKNGRVLPLRQPQRSTFPELRGHEETLRQEIAELQLPTTPTVARRSPEDASFPHTVKSRAASVMAAVALAAATTFAGPHGMPPAFATDSAKVGACLLQQCQLPLAKCILDPSCLTNLVCLQTCNGRPDESQCQIRCGDVFDDKAVGEFNTCAVSQKKCVPKTYTTDYPLPPADSVTKQFDAATFDGRWYISAGLNQIFDCFPCQVHFFDSPAEGQFVGDLSWRVVEPDGEFVTKRAIQTFLQDPENPGLWLNHDNEFLHYEDDWYILDWDTSKKGEEFILIYYRGRNDAWDGYGGAVLYTRSPTVPSGAIPRISAACTKANLDFTKFIQTDNSCKDSPDADTTLRMREQTAKKTLIFAENQLAAALTNQRGLVEKTGKEVTGSNSKEAESLKRIKQKADAFDQAQKLAQSSPEAVSLAATVVVAFLLGSGLAFAMACLRFRMSTVDAEPLLAA